MVKSNTWAHDSTCKSMQHQLMWSGFAWSHAVPWASVTCTAVWWQDVGPPPAAISFPEKTSPVCTVLAQNLWLCQLQLEQRLKKWLKGWWSCPGNNLMILIFCLGWWSPLAAFINLSAGKPLPCLDKFPFGMIPSFWGWRDADSKQHLPVLTQVLSLPQLQTSTAILMLTVSWFVSEVSRDLWDNMLGVSPHPWDILLSWVWQVEFIDHQGTFWCLASHSHILWRGRWIRIRRNFFFLWWHWKCYCGCCQLRYIPWYLLKATNQSCNLIIC